MHNAVVHTENYRHKPQPNILKNHKFVSEEEEDDDKLLYRAVHAINNEMMIFLVFNAAANERRPRRLSAAITWSVA